MSIKAHNSADSSILNFGTKIAQKRVFLLKKRTKKWHHHWIFHIQISLGTKFQLKMAIFIFWNKFPQKGLFWSKTEMNITMEFCIFKLFWKPNFSLIWKFRFSGPNLPKRLFPVENGRNEHHHGVLYIQIRLGSKFQPTLTVSIFLSQICPKNTVFGISTLKLKKWTPLVNSACLN